VSKIEIVGREIAFAGWLTLSITSIRMADGRVMRREVVEHGKATAVLAYDPERRMAMLVRQLRAPVYMTSGEELLLEAIAGMLDDGTDAPTTARREAMEEAGLRLGELEFVADAWPSPGMLTERLSLFLAPYTASDRIGAGGGLADEHEQIEVVEMPLRDLAALVDEGRMYDMKTLALTQSLRVRRPHLFEPVS
jgi:nudix-type nucleoside diphosphatase (YffH/AdpP family)